MFSLIVATVFFASPTDAEVNCRAATILAFAGISQGEAPKPAPSPTPAPEPTPEPAPPSPKPSNVAPQALVFWSEDCPPCKALIKEIRAKMAPAGWSIGPEKMIRFYEIQDDQTPIAKKHKIGAGSPMPQIVIVRGGREIGRIIGYVDGIELSKRLNAISSGWQARK